MTLPEQIKNDIWEYCRVNSITNIDEFTLKMVKQGFTIEKFGSTPINKQEPTIVEKIVEKIVEVEKLITDDIEIKKLTDRITELESLLTIEKQNNEELKKTIESTKNKKDIYGEG